MNTLSSPLDVLSIIQKHTKVVRVNKNKSFSRTVGAAQGLFCNANAMGDVFLTPGTRALILACPHKGFIHCKLCNCIVDESHFVDNHKVLPRPRNLASSYIYMDNTFYYSTCGIAVADITTAILLSLSKNINFYCNVCENLTINSPNQNFRHLRRHLPATIEMQLENDLCSKTKIISRTLQPELGTVIAKLVKFLETWESPSIFHARDEILYQHDFENNINMMKSNIWGILNVIRIDHPDTNENRLTSAISKHINVFSTPNAEISSSDNPRITSYSACSPRIQAAPIEGHRVLILGNSTLITEKTSTVLPIPLPEESSFTAIPINYRIGLYIDETKINPASCLLLRLIKKNRNKIFILEISIYTDDGLSIDYGSIVRQLRIIRKCKEQFVPQPNIIVAAAFPSLNILNDFATELLVNEHGRGEMFLALEAFRNNLVHLPLVPHIFPSYPDVREEIVAIIPDFLSETNITPAGSRMLTSFLKKVIPDILKVLE